MKRIKLLDCTLRDGGSINNWNFGQDRIINILQYLNDAKIDIIETGFLQNNIEYNPDKTITTDITQFNNIIEKIKNKNFKSVVMIDTGKFDINLLPKKKETLIDGIRLMFKKNEITTAKKYAEYIKNSNYELSLNPVSITTYEKSDLKELFKLTNSILPSVIYIIDTYGLLNNKQTKEYFRLFDENIANQIEIGYHSHNNMQLAFSNSAEIINYKTPRKIIVDSSLYGMGKRAGNTNTELISQYLNNNFETNYDINKIISIIEKEIMPLHTNFQWGYSIIHYIAAINKCHSDYVSYLYNEKKLNFAEINNILNKIAKNEKLTFNKNYIDNIFIE